MDAAIKLNRLKPFIGTEPVALLITHTHGDHIAFLDDYLFKTLDLQYLKLEYKDSFLWNITHKIFDGFLPETLTHGLVLAITAYLIYIAWKCRGCTGSIFVKKN